MITVKQLKSERKTLRKIVSDAVGDLIPFNNSVGGLRREYIIVLLKMCSDPDRRAIDLSLLRAVNALLAYDDKLAIYHLEFSINETYLENIKWLKKEKEKKK